MMHDLQNLEDGFSSRPVNITTPRDIDQSRKESRIMEPQRGNINMSMIAHNDMPWSSIPQKQVSFQNVEQVRQQEIISR